MSNDLNIEGWSKCLNCSEAQRDVRMWYGLCEDCHWSITIDHDELNDLAKQIRDMNACFFVVGSDEDKHSDLLLKLAHNVGLLIEDEDGSLIVNPKLRRQK